MFSVFFWVCGLGFPLSYVCPTIIECLHAQMSVFSTFWQTTSQQKGIYQVSIRTYKCWLDLSLQSTCSVHRIYWMHTIPFHTTPHHTTPYHTTPSIPFHSVQFQSIPLDRIRNACATFHWFCFITFCWRWSVNYFACRDVLCGDTTWEYFPACRWWNHSCIYVFTYIYTYINKIYCVLFLNTLVNVYQNMYIYIYLHIYLYIYIYIQIFRNLKIDLYSNIFKSIVFGNVHVYSLYIYTHTYVL